MGATSAWPSLEALTALDAVPRMIDLGRELGRFAPHRAVEAATWVRAEVPADLPRGPYDLVVLSYVLTELSPAAIPETVRRAWEATAGTLVLIMPGTPAGYAKIILARAQLLGNGGHVVAPCPHDSACPMIGEDWCHFAVRLPRSQLHKSAKQGVLGFEDEKFSYVGVSREPGHRATARVVRHPQIRPGHVTLELCAREGLRTLTVTKRHKDAFRHARKSAWGDSYDAAVLGMAIETKREARRGLSTLEDDQDVGGD